MRTVAFIYGFAMTLIGGMGIERGANVPLSFLVSSIGGSMLYVAAFYKRRPQPTTNDETRG